jgi:hypothetical protein
MKDRNIVDHVAAASPNRRSFLNKIAVASAAVAAGTGMSKFSEGQTTTTGPSDADILNFALNLEYLEAEFYTVATTGMNISQIGIGITGTGTAGATTGGAQVNFTNATFQSSSIAMQIAADERAHVTLIRAALTAAGAQPIAKPAINLNALGIGFGGIMDFLQLARAFEDIGVTAYAGAAPLISDKGILGYAARIAQAEASHSENIRLQIATLGVPTTQLDSLDILPPPSGSHYFPLTSQGLTQTRTPGQVLYLAYGNMANATSGGFFPNGVNGTLNMSSNPAANNGTTAVVTPSTLTTSQASITLSGSGSTAGTGSLTYLYSVLPGGKVPALLQTSSNPVVTVEFVNGPGTYMIQLTVTDGAGNTAVSAPIVIMYTGM